MPQDQNNLVWLDMEMTGLDPERDRIIEMAIVVTDGALNELGDLLAEFDRTQQLDLARDAKLTASNIRGGSSKFALKNLVDGKRNTYWATDDSVPTPEVTLEFRRPMTFNVVSLREFLPLGQRIDAFALDAWRNGTWTEFAKGTSIGNRKLVRTGPITTQKLRLRITQAAACPALSELGIYAEPSM